MPGMRIIKVNKRLVLDKEDIMVFDLARYIDEPLVYFDNNKKIDDQKMFLLGLRIRSDMVDLLLNGTKADEITVKRLDPAEDQSFGLINMVAESALSDWDFEWTGALNIEETPVETDKEVMQANSVSTGANLTQVKCGEEKILKKTIANFKMSDSKHREGAVIRALQEDFAAISDQLNSELNVFPLPMREMIMMTLLDRFHSWEKCNWE